MLTPFDDYPIHPSADPIAHPATGDPNHYDRYWLNGQDRDGRFFIAGAMGHYPVRDVVDGAFSIVIDGVEHSTFASGRMPKDRTTAVGPLGVEVLEPMRVIRLSVDPAATGLGCDLTFRAKTVAIEEPRQKRVSADGVLMMDHTRLTQWGGWEGTVWIDGRAVEVDRRTTVGTRDRSWGVRPVGTRVETNRQFEMPQIFWHWAPLHFDDLCTHMAFHENQDGSRWLETAMVVPLLEGQDAPTYGVDPTTPLSGLEYSIEWEPGRRELKTATFRATDPEGKERVITVEKQYTFRMRGIGYTHAHWGHGTSHGELEVGREDIGLDEFDPLDLTSVHLQNVVTANFEGRRGVGVVEQFVLGPHDPTGITGFLDGWQG